MIIIMYSLFYYLMPQKEPQLALKQSERLYYRNPGHSRNLMLLAHLYEKAGKLEEARATLVTLENLRPGDRRVQSLAEKLG